MQSCSSHSRSHSYAGVAVATLAVCCGANAAWAQAPVEFELAYTGDIVGPISGARERGAYLDNLDLSATFDMEALAGWSEGTIIFAHVLSNSGDMPNDAAQTLQGIDNIEVSREALRLYEFWVEANIGALNARAGLYDVNSEFYFNEAAGLLIAPAFGIGSELAATGPNGPSIFPSTALALRVRAPLSAHFSAQFAVVNAYAGVPGDPGGVDTALDDGALLIGELSWDGDTQLDVGAWTYTDEQEDIRLTTGLGAPVYQRAAGAYVTVEHEVRAGTTLFARAGISDGDTTPYSGGWQAGVLFDGVLASRPDSQLSFGAYQGRLSSKFRANLRDGAVRAAEAESGVELTYSDQVTPWLRLQPDVQLVLDPSGDRDRQDVWIAGLRFVITPFGQ